MFGAGYFVGKAGLTVGTGVYNALPTWFGNGISLGDSEQTSFDSKGSLTTTATTTNSDYACKGYSGSFNNASTTFFSVKNPNAATSTAFLRSAEVTGISTSTMLFEVGTSTTPAPTTSSAISGSLVSATIATGTLAYFSDGIVATGIPTGGTASGGVRAIQLAPNEYLTGYGSTTNANTDNGGILGNSNTFDGTYRVAICR